MSTNTRIYRAYLLFGAIYAVIWSKLVVPQLVDASTSLVRALAIALMSALIGQVLSVVTAKTIRYININRRCYFKTLDDRKFNQSTTR